MALFPKQQHTKKWNRAGQTPTPGKQRGLTLLEVLIALSIFAMIGVASYQVLASVSTAQEITQQHSAQLSRMQKTLRLIDTDLQQLVKRDIRTGENSTASYLQINGQDYVIELTRAGWSNPLMLSRSSLQRVAYDIGPHPDAKVKNSSHYQDKNTYLRRHFWRVLDRTEDSQIITQVLLPDIERLTVAVVSDRGRTTEWPLEEEDDKKADLKGIEMTFEHNTLGSLTRLYRVH